MYLGLETDSLYTHLVELIIKIDTLSVDRCSGNVSKLANWNAPYSHAKMLLSGKQIHLRDQHHINNVLSD